MVEHNKKHLIADSADHDGSANTPNQMIKADANGLPIDASNTDTEVSSAVTKSHDRQHAMDSAPDHAAGTQGDILYAGAAGAWAKLSAGTDGQFLKTQGAGANPQWDIAQKSLVVATNGKDQGYFKTNSHTYVPAGRFVFAGSSVLGTPSKMNALVRTKNNNKSLDVRIYDLTNSLVVATASISAAAGSNVWQIIAGTTISNIPPAESIFEIQVESSDNECWISSIEVRF